MDKLEIVCMENEAFFKLFEMVLQRIQPMEKKQLDKWISGPEAMRLMRIKSKTTLQKLRDQGRIRFTQPDKKNILYDMDSINDYLQISVCEPFESGYLKWSLKSLQRNK